MLGWLIVFPSRAETILWRAAVLLEMSVLCVYGISEVVLFWKSDYGKTSLELGAGYKHRWPWSLLFWVPATVYFSVRLALIVEVFASLRNLPAGAYVKPIWSEFLPHF